MRGISWLAGNRLVSQEALCSIQYVTFQSAAQTLPHSVTLMCETTSWTKNSYFRLCQSVVTACFAIFSQAHSRFLVYSYLCVPFRYRIYLTQRKHNAVAVFILLQSVRQLKNRYLASVVTVQQCSWPWENNATLLHHCVRVGREISFPRTRYNWRDSLPSYLLPVSLFTWTMNNICSHTPPLPHTCHGLL